MIGGRAQQLGALGQSQGAAPVHYNGFHDAQRSTHMIPVKRTGELRQLQEKSSSAMQEGKSKGGGKNKGHDDAQIARYVIIGFLGLPFVSFICFLLCRGELWRSGQRGK